MSELWQLTVHELRLLGELLAVAQAHSKAGRRHECEATMAARKRVYRWMQSLPQELEHGSAANGAVDIDTTRW